MGGASGMDFVSLEGLEAECDYTWRSVLAGGLPRSRCGLLQPPAACVSNVDGKGLRQDREWCGPQGPIRAAVFPLGETAGAIRDGGDGGYARRDARPAAAAAVCSPSCASPSASHSGWRAARYFRRRRR